MATESSRKIEICQNNNFYCIVGSTTLKYLPVSSVSRVVGLEILIRYHQSSYRVQNFMNLYLKIFPNT